MTQRRSRFAEEMRIIPVGWAIAAIVGFAATQLLFMILRWTHQPDLPAEPWWTLLGLPVGLMMAAAIALIGYIYADSKRRGMNAVLWTLLVVLIPKPIGFIAYFLLRKPLVVPCPQCGAPVGADFHYCPKCGHAITPTCNHCGRSIERDYVVCPYCGKTVGAAVSSSTLPDPTTG